MSGYVSKEPGSVRERAKRDWRAVGHARPIELEMLAPGVVSGAEEKAAWLDAAQRCPCRVSDARSCQCALRENISGTRESMQPNSTGGNTVNVLSVSVCLSLCLSICLSLSHSLSVSLSLSLCLCLFVSLSLYLPVCLSVCLSLSLSLCLCLCLSLSLSVSLCLSLSLSLSLCLSLGC